MLGAMIVPDAVKPFPNATLPASGSDIVGVTTTGVWMLLPKLIASNPATPVKFGVSKLAMLFNVVCRSVPVSVIAGVDSGPVTLSLPLPLTCAICVVPPHHLKLKMLVFSATLLQIVPPSTPSA